MRMHPFKKIEMMHKGVDFAASKGTPVIATGRGIIKETGFKPEGYGRYILIEHDGNYSTFYSQLDEANVEEGQKVNANEIIGKVGSSGLSTGPHLHYEIRENGIAIDPSPYLQYE
jgi:murein DD-endopeptidase MepM/ murein hydrolase activator NlpD